MFNRLKLRTRLFAALGLMAVFSLVAGLLNLWSVRQLGGQLDAVTQSSVPELRASMEADMAHDCARAAVFRAVIGFETGNNGEVAEGVKEFREATKTHGDALAEIGRKNSSPAIQTALKETGAGLADYIKTGEAVAALIQQGAPKTNVQVAQAAFQAVFEVLAVKMEKLSDLIQADVSANQTAAGTVAAQSKWLATASTVAAVFTALFIALALDRQISRPLARAVSALETSSIHLSTASGQIAGSSQNLAESASEQAASLEETSASLEEISAMTRRNAENSTHGSALGRQARDSAGAGLERLNEMGRTLDSIKSAVGEMQSAVSEMQSSSQEISKIIKTIDEIAFQTNLLALNAAVEAARAGEAGMGFAVVADEVRALAQRSAQAAKDTSEKIESAVKRSEVGGVASAKVVKSLGEVEVNAANIGQVFQGIVKQVTGLDEVINQIASASQEQSQGTNEVNMAVNQMDKITQTNASAAEENAAAAQELNKQASDLHEVVRQLHALVSNGRPPAAADRVELASISAAFKPVKRAASLSRKGKSPAPVSPSARAVAATVDDSIPMPEPSERGGFQDF
jgi:methyl-accepting chemotaxis protein